MGITSCNSDSRQSTSKMLPYGLSDHNKVSPPTDQNAAYSHLQARQLLDKGNSYLGNPETIDSAVIFYKVIVDRFHDNIRDFSEKQKREVVSRALNNLGYIHTFHRLDFKKANACLNEALDIAMSDGDQKILPLIYWNLAGIYVMNDLFYQGGIFTDKTLSYYHSALQSAKATGNWPVYLAIFNNVLNTSLSIGTIELIKEELEEYHRLQIPSDTQLHDFTYLHCRGVELAAAGNFDEAIAYFSKLETLSEMPGYDVRLNLMALDSKSYCQAAASDYEGAIATIEKAIGLASSSGQEDVLVSLYRNMSSYQASLGKAELSERFRILFLTQKDSIFNECGMKSVSSDNFRNEMESMETQVREMALKHKIQKMTIWLLIIGLSSVVAILGFLFVHYRKVKRTNRRLFDSYREKLALEEEIISITPPSECHISPTCHDTPATDETHDDNNSMQNENPPSDINDASTCNDDAEIDSQLPNRISKEYAEMIMRRVRNVMSNHDDVYSQEFSLTRLSELTECSKQTLSQILNIHGGKNFYSLLAEYRIKRACQIFDNPQISGQYTIESIALMVGFKSRSNFSACFKRVVGLTPNRYQQMSRSDIKRNHRN